MTALSGKRIEAVLPIDAVQLNGPVNGEAAYLHEIGQIVAGNAEAGRKRAAPAARTA